MFKDKGERNHTICFYNTRSYWPTAYSPETNSLYVPYNDNCLDMGVSRGPHARARPEFRAADKNAGVARIDMSTGRDSEFYKGSAQTNGSVVVTAGGVAFWGDLGRHFYALDATSGKVLWQTAVGGSVSVSTITYAVNGKQYVAVMTGDGLMTQGLLNLSAEGKSLPKSQNAVYVFALPEPRK